jgi:hypothetical protein
MACAQSTLQDLENVPGDVRALSFWESLVRLCLRSVGLGLAGTWNWAGLKIRLLPWLCLSHLRAVITARLPRIRELAIWTARTSSFGGKPPRKIRHR